MHITVWLYGEPVEDFDLDNPDIQLRATKLSRFLDYLNYHTKNRVYELSETGERVQLERRYDAATG